MGAELSTQNASAETHASQGWPAFMNAADLRSQMLKFRVHRSVLGRRVRMLDRGGGCIEYVKLSKLPKVYYQRVDAPCSQRASIPKFPHASAPHELPDGGSWPYRVTVRRPNYCEVTDPATKQCATYRRANSGIWVKVGERCDETKHDLEVAQQRRQLERQLQDQRHRDMLLAA